MADNVIRTITIRGSSEGLDKLTADIKKLAAAEQGLAVVSDDLTKSQLSLEQQLKRQTLRLDEAARAQANYDREVKLSQRGVDQGLKTAEQHARTVELATQRYGAASTATQNFAQQTSNLTKQTSRNTAEMLNLGRQVADVGVSLQAGQSLITVGIQQGAQILDVFASSGRTVGQIFGQAATWAGRFVTSTAGVVTGIAAIGAAAVYAGVSWQDGQREIDRALIGVGKRAGLTRDEINQMADTTTKSSRLSSSELRGTALELIKTGTIYGENIGKINSLVEGFAIQTGQSAKEAGKALAEIFGGDIVQGADKLNAIYGNLSGRMRQYIVDLDTSGQRQKAIAVLADEAGKKTKESADAVGFWARSWQLLGQAASGAFDAMGKGMTNLTGIGETRLAALQTRLNFLKEGLKEQEQRSAGGGVGVDTERLERSRAAVKALTDEIARLKKESEDISQQSVAEKIGLDADNAVRALLPFIEQLDKARKAQAEIAKAQATPGADQGLAQYNKQAADAAKVLELNLMAAADQQKRMNANALELAFIYNTQNIGVAKTLDGLSRQLPVAQAVGQMAKIEAQYKSRVAELSQSMEASDATRIAAAERAVKLAEIESQHQETMIQLRGQLDVASQVTGIGQINAQYEATVASLTLQIGLERAIEQAEMGRATAIAQVNAEADRTLYSLQQEGELIRASSDEEKDRIKARQTYDNLVRKGVDTEKARAVASKQLQNAEEERSKQELANQERAIANIRTATDAWAAYKQGVISWSVANDEAGKVMQRTAQATEDAGVAMAVLREEAFWAAKELMKFVPFFNTATDFIQQASLYQSKQGGVSQFNPAGYTSTIGNTALIKQSADALYGPGNYTLVTKSGVTTVAPTAEWTKKMTGIEPMKTGADLIEQMRERARATTTGATTGPTPEEIASNYVNSALARGGVDAAISGILSGSLGMVSGEIPSGYLKELNELLTPEARTGTIEREIAKLREEPISLAREQLIQELTESIDNLKGSVDKLSDVFSPFYSSDPRSSKLGFRTFAGGGIMTADGMLPLRQYQGGGMATSPQVAVFGEGSTPEAYVPVPSGRIPVELKMPANTNVRPVTINITVQGNADAGTVQALKQTAYQSAQQLRRVSRG